MKKLTSVKDRPIDGRVPNMTISSSTYQKGLKKLREQAKKEHRQLLTDAGIEDYRLMADSSFNCKHGPFSDINGQLQCTKCELITGGL